MADSKKTHKVGDVVEVKEGGSVRRPDGSEHTIHGGSYVLDSPGLYEVDGNETKVKS